jgi:hypothetical protein
MPRISLWQNGKHSDDYRFFDRNIAEMFTAGGTSIYIHKYLGPNNNNLKANTTAAAQTGDVTLTVADTTSISVGQFVFGIGVTNGTKVGAKTSTTVTLTQPLTTNLAIGGALWFSNQNDSTQPNYTNQSALNIQDLLLLENRDRKYDSSIYDLRGLYNVQDLDFDLSQFGLFLQNDTIFVTFHLNEMVQRLGRKIIAGDVLELPHLKDFYSLDETVPVALKRFYVVQDAMRSAEGYSPTWWPHLWRVKATPMVDSQEYKQILNEIQDGTNNQTLGNIISTASRVAQVNDAVIEQAEKAVPESGYDVTPYWIPPMTDGDKNKPPLPPDASPEEHFGGYLVGSGVPPNGKPVATGTNFPLSPAEGDFFLRLDFLPNRLFRYSGTHWVKVEDDQRTTLTHGNGQTQVDRFVNDTTTFTNSQGEQENTLQNLSKLLKPDSDY